MTLPDCRGYKLRSQEHIFVRKVLFSIEMSFGFTGIIYIFIDSIQTLLGTLCLLNVEVAASQDIWPLTTLQKTVVSDVNFCTCYPVMILLVAIRMKYDMKWHCVDAV